MSGLKALLMTSDQDYLPLTQYFPLNYDDNKSITELLIIAKHYKNCGKGIIEYKNKLFYYKTYIPNLGNIKDNNNNSYNKNKSNSSLSQSYSDYFVYSLDCNKKKFFLLFFCDLDYKQKDIDNLANNIFEILDRGAFEGHKLKRTSRDKINYIFEGYQNLSNNFENKIIINNIENINSFTNENSIESKNILIRKKRIDSRIVVMKLTKTKTLGEVSADIDDITSIKENDTNFSYMFKNAFNEEILYNNKKDFKKIKLWSIIYCFILLLIMSSLCILFFL